MFSYLGDRDGGGGGGERGRGVFFVEGTLTGKRQGKKGVSIAHRLWTF